jgi:hypothetical protein
VEERRCRGVSRVGLEGGRRAGEKEHLTQQILFFFSCVDVDGCGARACVAPPHLRALSAAALPWEEVPRAAASAAARPGAAARPAARIIFDNYRLSENHKSRTPFARCFPPGPGWYVIPSASRESLVFPPPQRLTHVVDTRETFVVVDSSEQRALRIPDGVAEKESDRSHYPDVPKPGYGQGEFFTAVQPALVPPGACDYLSSLHTLVPSSRRYTNYHLH